MAKFLKPDEARFHKVCEHLKRSYNVASEAHALLCAHHYQDVQDNPFRDLGYFELNVLFGFYPIPLCAEREAIYFPEAIAA